MISLDLPPRLTPRPAKTAYRSYYSGAQSNRLTSDWFTALLSADQEIKTDIRALRGRSRKLFRDSGHFAGFRSTLKDNVVGWEGIRVNPRVMSPRKKLLTDDNEAIEDAWNRWGEAGTCTADGRLGWWETTRQILDTWSVDGECFIRHLRGFDNAFGYAIQLIDPDLLDESFNVQAARGQYEIRMGVELNGYGRPVGYWFWERHPSDPGGRGTRVRVPAEDIEHLFHQLRPGQTRGLPAATPVLFLSHMLDGFTEAEVVAARIGASAGGGFFWMSADDAQILGIAGPTEDDLKKPIEFEAESGLSRQLPPGWQHKDWDPAHPTTRYAEFQKAILRVIARGMGVSYMSFAGDLSDTSYASGRMGQYAERDFYRSFQRALGTRACSPIYKAVLRMGALTGAVTLPYPDVTRCLAHEWEYRGWPMVDPKSDVDATAKAIALRIKSRQQACAELGFDFQEVIDDHQEEEVIAAKAGIDLPLVDAGNSAAIAPGVGGDNPAPPPDLNPATNGNGAYSFVDVLPPERFAR